MLNKKLETITVTDLNDLIINQVLEKKILEYKSELPGDADSARKEFLADVSSFANTEGGDIIFGITETNSTLQNDIGFEIENVDKEIARLENMIRDGISPRVSVDMHAIKSDGNKQLIILRTKISMETPHRVTYKAHDKFYKRNSNGKYPIDVGELRAAFTQSQMIVDRIKNFRKTRIADIKAGETPLSTSDKKFISIHIAPLSAFSAPSLINTSTLNDLKNGKYNEVFTPFCASSFSHRINLDGVLVYCSRDVASVRSYTQLYRDGRIESVESSIISDRWIKGLPLPAIENMGLIYIKQTIDLLIALNFQPPFYIFLSVIGVNGMSIITPPYIDSELINRDDLLLPEAIIEELTANDISKKMRPIFDMLWNAGGVSQSPSFDNDGNFITKNT